MAEKHPNLAAALAAFQLALPKIGKGNTAKVTSDKGNYSYKYADLSDVSAAVLPALAAHGLSFSSKPTLTEDGRFVLAYVLRHEVDGEDAGTYPLPATGTPQSIGSAISYARRYVLSAVTGVAPDEDDDGQAASTHQSYTAPAAPRRQAPYQRPAETPTETAPERDAVVEARKRLAAIIDENNWSRDLIASRYKSETGHDLGAAVDAALVEKFTDDLFAHSDHELGRNGAPA